MRLKIQSHLKFKYERFALASKDETGDKAMSFMAIVLNVIKAFPSPMHANANRKTARA